MSIALASLPTFTRAAVLREARRLIGVPWVHEGRDPAVGLDCVGQLFVMAWRLGYPRTIDVRGYGLHPDGVTLRRTMRELMNPISLAEADAGDVYLMRIKRDPQHVAVISDRRDGERRWIIHALRGGVGVVVEHPLDGQWPARVLEAYRFKGLIP